jgi:hypothetical protein
MAAPRKRSAERLPSTLQHIPGRSRMRKGELVEALVKANRRESRRAT